MFLITCKICKQDFFLDCTTLLIAKTLYCRSCRQHHDQFDYEPFDLSDIDTLELLYSHGYNWKPSRSLIEKEYDIQHFQKQN